VKFAGQLKFPDLDHPGLPVVFLVEDNHASILLDGESLGRWALFDVEATRLVAKAFQVHLGGEEITFVAEEPIDFAYKGVEHMAQTWAKAKALSMPRRSVVVRKARRDTQPSRLSELRAAVIENLEAPPAPQEVRKPAGTVAERIAAAREAVEEARAPSPASPGIPTEVEVVDVPAKVRLIPGPGLVGSLQAPSEPSAKPTEEPNIEVVEEPVAEVEEMVEVPVAEVEEVVEVPVAEVEEMVEEPVAEVEEMVEEPVAEVDEVVEEPVVEVDEVVEEPVPVIEAWLDKGEQMAEETEVLTPWFAGAEDSEETRGSDDPIEWQYQPEPPTEPVEPAAASAEDDEELEELSGEVKELIGTPAGSDEGLFVDLGRYEEVRDASSDDDDDIPPGEGQPAEREPVLVGTTQEKSGLLGAVRSAFVRSKAPHEHEFVDAPGGMGLTRQICADCGHISIRSDD